MGAAFTDNRSEVLAEKDPLPAIQQVHWTIHRAFVDYQTAAEERRRLAADIGQLIRKFVDVLSPRDGARTMRAPLMSMS